MKHHKLVLIFSDDCEVSGIDKVLVFNNVLDAETYLRSNINIKRVKITPEDNWFSFETIGWSGDGRTYWAVNCS